MKGATWPLLACSLCACLQRENVGEFDEPASACPDPAAALTREEGKSCIAELLDDLSQGPWAGTATSGSYVAEVSVEFGAEGSFRLSNTGDPRPFGVLFFPAETKVEGRYDITDLLDGKFFGNYKYEAAPIETALDYLHVEGDALSFSWRSKGSDFSPITSRLVLTRQR